MFRILAIIFLTLVPAVSALGEESHRTLGFGRLFTNDILGDGQDRWRTGAYVLSWMRGTGWDGARPDNPLELVEFRGRMEILAPANLKTPAPGDRPYAGVLSFSAHSHWQAHGFEVSFGAGLTLSGPMTGVGELHRIVHKALGMTPPSGALVGQIGNRVFPKITAETGRRIPLGSSVALRPFLQAETGAETLVRAGAEVLVGQIWSDMMLLRDEGTGQLYTGLRGETTGLGLILGADVARVTSSSWLPSQRGYQLTDARTRARAGLRWQGEKSAIFYGLTYLGREFQAQPEGQFVGSITLDIRF